MSVYVLFVFFFFKQKTAYEMRISDWSSDVCSSDLPLRRFGGEGAGNVGQDGGHGQAASGNAVAIPASFRKLASKAWPCSVAILSGWNCTPWIGRSRWRMPMIRPSGLVALSISASGNPSFRSEDHTSALQSLMRISYAVFC